MSTTMIDQVATAVEEALLRRGFVHEDPAAYRAGVREATAAIRAELVKAAGDRQAA